MLCQNVRQNHNVGYNKARKLIFKSAQPETNKGRICKLTLKLQIILKIDGKRKSEDCCIW
jgi:hypothetical protein